MTPSLMVTKTCSIVVGFQPMRVSADSVNNSDTNITEFLTYSKGDECSKVKAEAKDTEPMILCGSNLKILFF